MSGKQQELADLRKSQNRSRASRIVQDSKDRLKQIADKKFRTCFISALSEFENIFGTELWGHGLSEKDVTREQEVNKARWEHVRRKILDKGNAQSRALGKEIDLHRVEFEGYRMDFGGNKDAK